MRGESVLNYEFIAIKRDWVVISYVNTACE